MFGVDRSGRDVLSPQFRKGGSRPDASTGPLIHRNPEQEMALASTLQALKSDKKLLSDLRREITLKIEREKGHSPQESEVVPAIQAALKEKAEYLVERSRQMMSEEASRSSVLRT